MPRGLNAVLKTLQNASKSRKDQKFTAIIDEIATLVRLVKPGDALDAKVAGRLVTMFDERMVLLYSLMPREAIELAVAYFLALASHLKSTEPSDSWQHVASKGILAGLENYLEDGDATHFERPFFTCLCQILTVTSRAKLTIDLRQSIGTFLSEILPKHPQAKKWLLDSRVLGVAALGKLIMTETDFRVLDNIFAIAARLTPRRDDPQARRAFLSDVFNSASSKARLGETICKNITRIMDEPRKGPWFHLSDQLFTELGGNNKRPQRFVLQSLEVCGENLAADQAALRLFLDSEIVLDAFPEDEEGIEEMITTSFDNLRKVLIEELETDTTSIIFELHSVPSWHNPRDSLVESHSYIKFRISSAESKRLHEVLASKGQGTKLSDSAAVHKQSFSRRDMKLEQVTMAVKGKTDAIESYLHSDVPSPKSSTSTIHSVKFEEDKAGHSVGKQHGSPSPPKAIFDSLFEENSLSNPIKASSTVTDSKIRFSASPERKSPDIKHASVKRGVILDSDDDEQIPTPKPKQSSKRQASALSDIENVLSSNIKRPRVATGEDPTFELTKNPSETAKKGQAPNMEEAISLDSPFLDLSTYVKSSNKDGLNGKLKTIIVPQNLSKSEPSAPLHTKGRIRGMKAMNGKSAAFSTPCRPSGRAVPKAVSRAREPTKKNLQQTLELTEQLPVASTGKAIPKSASKIPSLLISSPSKPKSMNDTTKPSKAIWEADDFSQQARMISTQPANIEIALPLQSTPSVPPANALSSSAANGVHKTVTFGENDTWAFDIEGFESIPEIGVVVEDPKHGIITEDDGPYDEPSSPIRAEMVVRRKLRDATIIVHSHPKKPESGIKGTNGPYKSKLGNIKSATTLAQELQVKPAAKPQDNSRALLHAKADWKAAARSPVLKAGSLALTHAAQASMDQRKSRDDRAIRAAQKLKNMTTEITQKKPHVTKRKSSSSTEVDGMDSDAEESKVPKTEIDAIAEVMTKIQDRLMANIKVKVSGTKGEVRVARTNLLEAAVADLDLMQGNLEASFARFMQLEETYGQVTQSVVGRLEELQATNERVAIMFRNIVQEHDRITTATRLPRSPFTPPLPACLT